MFLCVLYLCRVLVPFLMHCSRLMNSNKDLLTYLLTYWLHTAMLRLL